MKMLIAMALTLTGFSTFAATQDPSALPEKLVCQEVLNVYGHAELESFNLDLKSFELTVTQPKNNDLVVLDFSNGEEISKFEFKKEEIGSLTAGKIEKIRGLRTLGYWWADGDHTNSLTVVECAL